jgi:16S rRNA (uracil1498-N3)-methyltransferase
MDYYYSQNIDGDRIILDETESNHLLKVKRSVVGDEVTVSDGKGTIYNCNIVEAGKNRALLSIAGRTVMDPRNFRLHIAIAPTKNQERIEWFLEKATESGIEEVTFLRCRHSERKTVNIERLQKITLSALKQSRKAFLPVINPVVDFETFINAGHPGTRIICTTSAGENSGLAFNYSKGDSLLALIGPEGDFHTSEVAAAVNTCYKVTSLGKSRLRTETAGLAVCTIFNFINS